MRFDPLSVIKTHIFVNSRSVAVSGPWALAKSIESLEFKMGNYLLTIENNLGTTRDLIQSLTYISLRRAFGCCLKLDALLMFALGSRCHLGPVYCSQFFAAP